MICRKEKREKEFETLELRFKELESEKLVVEQSERIRGRFVI